MPGKELVQSVLRALDILEYTAENSHGKHLSEISDGLNLNRTTVYNLLKTLTERRYLKKDSSNNYHLGPRFLELVRKEMNSVLYRAAGRELLRMTEQIPGSIAGLAELSGEQIFVRLRVSPDRPGYLQSPMDFTLPVYTSCTGLCFLMQEQYRATLNKFWSFDEFGIARWETVEKLNVFLQKARSAGQVSMNIDKNCFRGAAEPVQEHFVLNICCPPEQKESAEKILHESVIRIQQQTGDWK